MSLLRHLGQGASVKAALNFVTETESFIGRPQLMQLGAMLEICFSQSGQVMSGMYCSLAPAPAGSGHHAAPDFLARDTFARESIFLWLLQSTSQCINDRVSTQRRQPIERVVDGLA